MTEPKALTEANKILKDALWMAYCSGRAKNKYIPEEVLPELWKRLKGEGWRLAIVGNKRLLTHLSYPVARVIWQAGE